MSKDKKRSAKWRISEFNRHRDVKDQVSTIAEMEEKIKEYYGDKIRRIYESPDGGKTVYGRDFGNYDEPRIKFREESEPIFQNEKGFSKDDVKKWFHRTKKKIWQN